MVCLASAAAHFPALSTSYPRSPESLAEIRMHANNTLSPPLS